MMKTKNRFFYFLHHLAGTGFVFLVIRFLKPASNVLFVFGVAFAGQVPTSYALNDSPLNALPIANSSNMAVLDDGAVLKILKQHNIPGAAVVLLRSGQTNGQTKGQADVVKGYGVRKLGSRDQVDADTLFRVGSISKSFTGLAIALLVVEGKLQLQTPIADVLPTFKQAEHIGAGEFNELTIGDFLTHRTGLDLQALDVLIWPQPNQFSAADFILAATEVRRTSPPRSQFRYSNGAYVLAGEVVARVSGMPFHRYVEDNIFKPLKMDGCVYGDGGHVANGATKIKNVATPHMDFKKRTVVIRPDVGVVPIGIDAAAGGARCSARSMLAWLQFIAHPSSAIDHPRLSAALKFATEARVRINPTNADADAGESGNGIMESYGLGFEVVTEGGKIAISHSGGVAGMFSYFAVWPESEDGLAVFINKSSVTGRSELVEKLKLALAKPIAKKRSAELSQELPAPTNLQSGPSKKSLSDNRPNKGAKSHPFAYLAGNYRANWLGKMSICEEKDGMVMRVAKSPAFAGDIRPIAATGLPGVFWRDVAIDSDSVIQIIEQTGALKNRAVKTFRLAPITTSDFDFSYVTFTRESNCSD